MYTNLTVSLTKESSAQSKIRIICCEMFGKRKKTSRRRVRYYGFRKSSNIPRTGVKIVVADQKIAARRKHIVFAFKNKTEREQEAILSDKFLLCFALYSNGLKL